MKKTILCLLAAILLTVALAASAGASASATPNQQLALRTGPNRDYVWIGTMPQTTSIRAFEFDSVNGVTWVLVEYESGGKVYRGYTGLKRMSVNGNIPWADHLEISVTARNGGTIYTAPSERAARRGALQAGDTVTLLEYENDYAFIEYYDAEEGAPSRGYVYESTIDGPGRGGASRTGVYAVPNQRLSFRTGPTTGFTELYTLPETTQITAFEYEQGSGVTWVLVEFMYNNERVRAYTGLKRMTVYGDIPWADHIYEMVYTRYGCAVYAAPSTDAAYRNRLNGGGSATVLGYDGNYAFIEYIDRDSGLPERGYVEIDAIYDEGLCEDDGYGDEWSWKDFGE